MNDYEVMIDHLYDEMDHMRDDNDSIVQYIDTNYQDEVDAMMVKPISKHYIMNEDGKGITVVVFLFLICYIALPFIGKHAEWLSHVDKLILEMLLNRTPPACIQANIYAMAKNVHPDIDIIQELPSLKHIKNL